LVARSEVQPKYQSLDEKGKTLGKGSIWVEQPVMAPHLRGLTRSNESAVYEITDLAPLNKLNVENKR